MPWAGKHSKHGLKYKSEFRFYAVPVLGRTEASDLRGVNEMAKSKSIAIRLNLLGTSARPDGEVSYNYGSTQLPTGTVISLWANKLVAFQYHASSSLPGTDNKFLRRFMNAWVALAGGPAAGFDARIQVVTVSW